MLYYYKERFTTYLFLIVILTIVLIFHALGIIWGTIFGNLYFDKIDLIGGAAVFIFILLCLGGLASTKLYFSFLIFQFIALPALVDNFLPGVYLGSQTELDASITPLFTHIDLYIFLGIAKGTISRNKFILVESKLLLLSIIILFSSSFINIFFSKDSQDLLLILPGFMQLRYLIEIYLLFSFYDAYRYSKFITIGLAISVIFLFIEASVFTKLIDAERLTSGTLGNNSYGNIIACITIYLTFVLQQTSSFLYRLLIIVAIGVGIITVILTQTRMAMLAGLFLFYIGTFYSNRKSFFSLLYWSFVFVGIGSFVIFSGLNNTDLAKRFDINKVITQIHLSPPWSKNKMIEIDSATETLSLLTRLKLYETSSNMIASSPIFGIGSGRWNYHKNEYGFDEEILLDAHNGYLAVISQYGLFAVIFIYLMYLWPIKIFKKKNTPKDTITYLSLIPVGMAICDLSNAGIYKHQIFALLSLCVIVLIHVVNKQNSFN